MSTKDIYSQSEHHMQRTIVTLKENFMKIRTGRAHTGLLEHITVDYYGSPTPISQVAQLGFGRCQNNYRSAVGKENGCSG